MNSRSVSTFFLACFFSAVAFAAPTSLTYQGRILKTDGTPLEYNNVSFLFQITDPTGGCIVYQEQVSGYDMSNSGGVFDSPIGLGTRSFPSAAGFTILDSLNNLSTLACQGGATYTPAVDDGRRLRVQFFDGAGWKLVTPDNIIRSVPYAGFAAAAVSAQKLGANVVGDFILKTGIPTCSAGTFLSWDGTALSCAPVAGSSGGTVTNVTSANAYLTVGSGSTTPALTLNVGTSANTVAAGNDARFSDSRAPNGTAGGDLSGTYPNPSVAKILGRDLDTTAPTSGQFLKFTGASKWAPATLAIGDVTGLSTSLSGMVMQSQFPASCSAAETLTFLSPSGSFTCSTISISGTNFGSQSANLVLASPDATSGTPTFRALTVNDLPAAIGNGLWSASGGNVYRASGNVGIGTTNPAHLIHADTTVTDPAYVVSALRANIVPAYTASSANGSAGVSGSTRPQVPSGMTMSGSAIGILGAGLVTNTLAPGTISRIIGLEADYGTSIGGSTGTTTQAMGLYVLPYHRSGNIGTSYGVYIDSPSLTGATVGSTYGVYQANASAKNYFAGNVGINTTSPGVALDVVGTIRATGFSGPLSSTSTSVGTGTAGAPSMSFSGDTTTGFYDASSNGTISVASGGVNTFNFTNSGLASPTAGGANLTTGAGTAGAPTFSFAGDTGTGWWRPAASTMAASTGGTERMRIDASGNVAIGTASPSNGLLDVQLYQTDVTSPNTAASFIDRVTLTTSTTGSSRGLLVKPEISVASGLTTTGGLTGAQIYAWRNFELTGDNGTVASVTGLNLAYGHYNNFATTPQTSGNAYGINLNSHVRTGQITGNMYDIYLAPISTGGTLLGTHYGLYSGDAAATTYFAGNVGVGTTTPGASLSLYKVSPNGTIASTGTAITGTGTTFTTTFSVGDQIAAAGQARTITAITSATAMTVSSAFTADLAASTPYTRVGAILNAGSVGIGTTLANNALDVYGGALTVTPYYGGTYRPIISLTNNDGVTTADPVLEMQRWSGSTSTYYGARQRVGNGDFFIDNVASPANIGSQTWTNRLAITAAGSVGIGTATPSQALVVNGNIQSGPASSQSAYLGTVLETSSSGYATSYLGFNAARSAAGTWSIYTDSTHNGGAAVWGDINGGISFVSIPNSGTPTATQSLTDTQMAAAVKMSINANGNVGIGTINPGAALDVVGTIRATAFSGPLTSSTTSVGTGTSGAPSMTFSGDTNTGFFDSSSNDTIGVATGGTNIFNFTATGLASPTTGGANITTAAGTVGAPTFSFAGDTGTGWWRPAASTMAASTGGVERVRIDSSGNVGIGTSSPTAQLNLEAADASNTVFIRNSTSSASRYPGLSIANYQNTQGGTSMITLSNAQGTAAVPLALNSGDELGTIIAQGYTGAAMVQGARFDFYADGAWSSTSAPTSIALSTIANGQTTRAERMRISNNGNVGIGTAVPVAPLNVVRTTPAGTITTVGTAVTGTGTNFTSAFAVGDYVIASGQTRTVTAIASATAMTLSAGFSSDLATATSYARVGAMLNAGNVGIGTNGPAAKLQITAGNMYIQDPTNTTVQGLFFAPSDNSQRSYLQGYSSSTTTNDYVQLGSRYGTTQIVSGDPAAPVPRITILNSGFVGVGTAAPVNAFEVQSSGGTAMTSSQIRLSYPASANGTYLSSDTNGFYRISGAGGGGLGYAASGNFVEVLRISASGYVGIGTTGPTAPLSVANSSSSGLVKLQNTATTGYSSVDMFDSAAAQTGGFGYANASAAAFGGKQYYYSLGKDIVFANSNTNASIAMTVSGSTGYVGIGTITPGVALDVYGTIRATAFSGPLTSSSTSVGTGTNGAPSMTFSGDTNTGFFDASSNDTIGVATGGINIFNFSTTGLVSPTTGGANITTAAGTAGAPTFSFAGDTGTGWWRPAASTMAASTGGTERMRIDSSGNVGIGTTAPSGNLDVASATAGTTLNMIGVGSATVASSNIQFYDAGSTKKWLVSNRGDNYTSNSQTDWLTTYYSPNGGTNWHNYMNFIPNQAADNSTGVVSFAGNVGIGTTTPGVALDVNGTVRGARLFMLPTTYGYGTGAYFGNTSAGNTGLAIDLSAATGGYASIQSVKSSGSTWGDLILNSSGGNVGVGTSTPGYLTDIRAASGGSVLHLSTTSNDDGAYLGAGSSGAFFGANAASNGTTWTAKATTSVISAMSGGQFIVYTDSGLTSGSTFTPTPRLYVAPTGSVGIGTQVPSGKLEINSGAAGATTGLIINTTSAAANTYASFNANGTVIGSISSAAGASVAFNTTSDVRLKAGFQPVLSPLKTLNDIEVANFYYLADPAQTRMDGFKAQQLYQVLPYAVTKPASEIDADGNIVAWMADYSKVVPLITAAVQELYAKFTQKFQNVDRDIASLRQQGATNAVRIEAVNNAKDQEIRELKARLQKQESDFTARLKQVEQESKARADKQEQDLQAIKKKLNL